MRQFTIKRPLLERETELELLGAVAERAAGGDGSVVIVEGAAGVGKSSLLDAADVVASAHGLVILAAKGSELESGSSFGLARQLLPSVNLAAADPDTTTDRERSAALLTRFQDELTTRIFAGSQTADPVPHLVRVDDAQWGDPASLRYLAHLALRVAMLPVVLVIGIRTGDAPTPSALDALRGGEATHLIRPRALTDGAVEQLVREACGADTTDELVAACATATSGNPFYLHELLRELATMGNDASAVDVASAAPDSVLRTVLARLGGMGEGHSRLAMAVAILGDGAPLSWAAELADIPVADAEVAADALAAAELLAPGEPLALAHPLIASTLRGDLGAFARARAHRRAADVLERAGAHAGQVANHLLHARPDGDATVVQTLREAAGVARERGDASAAAILLRRALDEPPASSQRGDVLIELARAEAIDSDPSAMGHLEEALGVVHNPGVRAEAVVDLARLLHQAGDYGRAAALAQRGLSELRPDDPLRPTLQAVFLGAGLIHPPLHQQASQELATLTREAAAGRPPSEPALLALIANQLSYGDGDGELAAALACRAFAQDPLVDRSSQGASLGFAGWTLIEVDALAAAAPLLDAAVDAAAQRGAVLAGSIASHCRAQLYLHRGQLELATLEAEQSLSAYRDGWAESSWSAPTLARAHLERGDLDAAAEAIRVGERGDPQRVEYVLLLEVRAALALARGDAERALTDATAAIAQVREGFGLIPMRGFDSRRLAALAAHRLGRAEEAGAFVDELLDQLRQVDAPRQHGATLACAGVLAGGDRGLALLHEAVATLERSQSCLVSLHARMELGAAQRRAGEAEPARESLSGVLERAEEFGAAPLVDRARSELWALGLRPRRAARTGIASLTPSEQRIAELAAKGLTTPQIAHELYVTRKTVESHLSHIYRKLEIRGRAELPRDLPGADDDAAEITGVRLTATG